MIRVLVCSDSRTYTALLTRCLEYEGDISVVGSYSTAEALMKMLPHQDPDLVVMDVELPGIDRISATKAIKDLYAISVLVLSGRLSPNSERVVDALAAGALDVLSKTEVHINDPASEQADALRRRITQLVQESARTSGRKSRQRYEKAPTGKREAAVVGVCASAGGPSALATVLADLPETLPWPVLIAQHMPSGFMDGLVRWFDRHVPAPVRMAEDGMTAEPGIWFAPDNAHLMLDRSFRFALLKKSTLDPYIPSANVLLQSLAVAAGPAAVAVVLTGLGRDGADGVAAIRGNGGLVIAQDEETSAVYGMPRAAADRGADHVLPLEQVARLLKTLRPATKKR